MLRVRSSHVNIYVIRTYAYVLIAYTYILCTRTRVHIRIHILYVYVACTYIFHVRMYMLCARIFIVYLYVVRTYVYVYVVCTYNLRVRIYMLCMRTYHMRCSIYAGLNTLYLYVILTLNREDAYVPKVSEWVNTGKAVWRLGWRPDAAPRRRAPRRARGTRPRIGTPQQSHSNQSPFECLPLIPLYILNRLFFKWKRKGKISLYIRI